jgi:predicted phage terminase large subunit-like protein
LPKKFDQVIQSWDCTFKKTRAGSYVAGQVWGRVGANYYLIDQARDRWSFSETVSQVRYLTRKWPRAIKKLVEDKANGPAIVDHLKNEISGMTEAPPHGDKEARAHAVEPYWSSGNVFLPHPSIAPWINDFVNEVTKFPASKNNDQVDSMTQALDYLGKSAIKRLKAAMAGMSS